MQQLSALRSTRHAVCEIPVVSDISAGGAATVTLASNAQSPTSISQPISSARCPSRKLAMPSPVSPTAQENMLNGYDASTSQYLVNGFTSGFQIGCLDISVQK